MAYDPKIGIKKTAKMGGVGTIGILIEVAVNSRFPGLFPPGTITAASITLYASISNWFKNRKKG